MASDYDQQIDPAQSYAERRGITFRERVAEIVRKLVPEKLRDRIDGLLDGIRAPGDDVPGPDAVHRPERGSAGVAATQRDAAVPGREAAGPEVLLETDVAEDAEAALRKARTRALIRHAGAVGAIVEAQEQGGRASPEQVKELTEARKAFEEVRPHGSHDAEAAYRKNPELASQAATGRTARAIRALQLETEIRSGRDADQSISPNQRADRFVERWQKLDRAGEQKYAAGDYSGYKAARSAMGDMAKSLERDPQLESLLANRKAELGIQFESGRRLGAELAFTHGIDFGRGRGIGI